MTTSTQRARLFGGIAVVSVTLLLATACAAPAETPGDESKGTIGIITGSKDNSLLRDEAAAARAVLEAEGYDVVSGVFNFDAAQELKLVQNYISLGVKGLVWDVADSATSAQAMQLAKDAGIPTVTMDQAITEDGIAIKQIYSDNQQCGQLAAEEFARLTGGSGDYAHLQGVLAQTNEQLRDAGISGVLEGDDAFVLIGKDTANWDQTEANQLTSTFLQKSPGLVGVIAENDTMALGAAAAIEAAGSSAIVVGIDGSSDAKEAISSGSAMKATAVQPLVLGAEQAAQVLVDYLADEVLPDEERQQNPCTIFNNE